MNTVSIVTGAARGLGLELCRQLVDRGHHVFACPRRTSDGLDALESASDGKLVVVSMDVGDGASIERAATTIASAVDRVDFVFNNAGIYPESGDVTRGLDERALVDAFRVNAVGPLAVAHAFLPLIREARPARLVQVTSLMGSIADNTSGGSYAYRMSKAALNMAVRNMGHELAGVGAIAVAVHPGWVRTDMGGSAAPLGIEDAVRDIVETALALTPRDNGTFVDRGGQRLEW